MISISFYLLVTYAFKSKIIHNSHTFDLYENEVYVCVYMSVYASATLDNTSFPRNHSKMGRSEFL